MPDRTAIVVSAVFASFLAGLALTTVSGAARAGNDCLTEPKDQPPQGSHWYYHVDQVTHHKCWHRRAEGLTIHQVGSSKPYPPQQDHLHRRDFASRRIKVPVGHSVFQSQSNRPSPLSWAWRLHSRRLGWPHGGQAKAV